jgi:hypothetical protein
MIAAAQPALNPLPMLMVIKKNHASTSDDDFYP